MNRDDALKYACSVIERHAKVWNWTIEMAIKDLQGNVGGYQGKDGAYCYYKAGLIVGRSSSFTKDREDGSWFFGWPELQRVFSDRQMTFEL